MMCINEKEWNFLLTTKVQNFLKIGHFRLNEKRRFLKELK